jgi:tripartite ATP-independent transporter DctM subunit
MNPIVVLFASFFGLCLIGVPIAISLLLSAFLVASMVDIPPIVMIQQMYTILDSYTLLAVPLFLLVGNVMDTGKITDRLVAFSRALVGHIRGGLGHVNVVANMIMAGISGSATADAAALGSVMIPAMKKEGYPLEMAAAINAAAATMGPIIPPSIMMIIYGAYGNVSIGAMFLGGAVPGVIIGIALMIFVYFWAVKNKFPVSERRSTLPEVGRALQGAAWALLAPLIIIVGIVGGFFTATEGGMIATLYSLFVTAYIYKTLKLKAFVRVVQKTLVATAQPLLCVAAAGAFGYMMAYLRVPAAVLELAAPIATSSLSTLLFFTGLFIILGTFMDATPAIIIFMPIVQSLSAAAGLNPVHVGVLITVVLCFGFVTPPYGLTLLLSAGIAGVAPGGVIRALGPIFLVFLLVSIILVFFPDIILFLPRTFMPQSVR